MITSIEDVRNSEIKADLCIVGAGAAGLELAHTLKESGLSIVLLEAGFESFDFPTQTLCRFIGKGRPISSANYTEPFTFAVAKEDETHLRQWGGTLNIWSGKWMKLDPIDLEHWPISYEELFSYYQQIAKEYQVEELLDWKLKPTSLLGEVAGLSLTPYLKEKSPTNIKEKYQQELQVSSNIQLVLGGNVVDIVLESAHSSVKELLVKSLSGKKLKVSAECFVLACGAIENARLLLSSNKQIRQGLGNTSGLLGMSFMDHPKGFGAFLVPFENKMLPEAKTYPVSEHKMFAFGISLSEEILKARALPHHHVHLFSAMTPEQKMIYRVKFYLEQLPNNNSTLTLSDEKDFLGVPLPIINWQFSDQDFAGFRNFVHALQEIFEKNRIGKLIIPDESYQLNFLKDASHHMGTTRMSGKESEGVVDAHGKVFGVDNLFVTGSSLFPRAGSANPTFTILALSRRLGVYLGNFFRK